MPQDNASGVWTALAQDLGRGIFYRPTADVFGFGGTRYMPLFFLLHASLIRLSLDPVVAGVTLTLASTALFDLGVLFVLRELGLDWSLAAPLSVLAHAAVAIQVLTLQVKGDFLAGALNLWGVYLGLRYARRPSWPWFAACTLALLGAFLTKFTTVGGAVRLDGQVEAAARRGGACGHPGGALRRVARGHRLGERGPGVRVVRSGGGRRRAAGICPRRAALVPARRTPGSRLSHRARRGVVLCGRTDPERECRLRGDLLRRGRRVDPLHLHVARHRFESLSRSARRVGALARDAARRPTRRGSAGDGPAHRARRSHSRVVDPGDDLGEVGDITPGQAGTVEGRGDRRAPWPRRSRSVE